MIGGKVLDVPALIDLATGRTQYMRALAYVMAAQGDTLAVPATALAHAAARLPDRLRTELAWAVESAIVVVPPLDARTAPDVAGIAHRHANGDIIIAHIAQLALARDWPVLTGSTATEPWRSLGITTEHLP